MIKQLIPPEFIYLGNNNFDVKFLDEHHLGKYNPEEQRIEIRSVDKQFDEVIQRRFLIWIKNNPDEIR